MSTGAAGGTFAEYGDPLAKLISAGTPSVMNTRTSGGSLDNLRCLNESKCDLALVAIAYRATHGTQRLLRDPLRQIRQPHGLH
jgi:TRAP-type uncharacterized transport system substrate-binding protein